MAAPKFEITQSTSIIGFHTHTVIDLTKPVEDQLARQRLTLRSGVEKGDPVSIQRIIENNASLRVGFGFSFESERQLSDMMEECLYELCNNFNSSMPRITSDTRGDWIGFMPYNSFERYDIEQLSVYGMILFNNELINFQTDVVKFISQHKVYRQLAISRDKKYRYGVFKDSRSSPDELEDAFHYYISAVTDTTHVGYVTIQYLEETIGVHFLGCPELFFELLDFYKLKGLIRE